MTDEQIASNRQATDGSTYNVIAVSFEDDRNAETAMTLLGGAAGLYAGALYDIHDAGETESALAGISSSVRVGRTALLAVVTEQSPDVVDTSMSGLGGTVLRRSVADVDAEVAAPEKAQRKANFEARKELIRGRQQHDKAAVSAKIAELKDKLPHSAQSRG